MNEKKRTHQLMNDFMRNLPPMNESEERIVWDNLNDIVTSAKEKVIADAENAIAKLRIFSK